MAPCRAHELCAWYRVVRPRYSSTIIWAVSRSDGHPRIRQVAAYTALSLGPRPIIARWSTLWYRWIYARRVRQPAVSSISRSTRSPTPAHLHPARRWGRVVPGEMHSPFRTRDVELRGRTARRGVPRAVTPATGLRTRGPHTAPNAR